MVESEGGEHVQTQIMAMQASAVAAQNLPPMSRFIGENTSGQNEVNHLPRLDDIVDILGETRYFTDSGCRLLANRNRA